MLGLVLVVLVVLGVYWPGVHGGFLFDDYPNLVDDPTWRMRDLDFRSFRRAMSNGFAGLGGRPLALLSFALDHLRAGLSPAAMKATNIAFHAINTALVYALGVRLARLAARDASARLGTFAAALMAAAWALHPLQVSTVLYVVQRMELGAATGLLTALLAYLNARDPGRPPRRRIAWGIACCAAVAVGVGFKETALLFPAFALALELLILRFRDGQGRFSRRLAGAYAVAAFAALTVFAFVVVPHYASPDAYAARSFTLGGRLLSQGPVLVMYLRQALLPYPDSLLFYYDHLGGPSSFFQPPWTAFSWLLLCVLASSAFLLRRRLPLAALGIAWFFAGHLLTSNVVPLELAFEHRNYLALFGLVLAVGQLLAVASARFHLDARRTAATVLVACLAFECALETALWSDELRLATALESRNPASGRASYALGRLLLERSGGDVGSPAWDLARKEFMHSASVSATSPLAEQALIITSTQRGLPVPPGIWDSLRLKLGRGPLTPEAEGSLWQLSNCREKGLCKFDDAELFKTYMVALSSSPTSARVHSMYATYAFNVLGDRPLAIRMMREARALAPADLQYAANLARFLVVAGGDSAEVEALVRAVTSANGGGTYDEDLAAIARLRGRRAH